MKLVFALLLASTALLAQPGDQPPPAAPPPGMRDQLAPPPDGSGEEGVIGEPGDMPDDMAVEPGLAEILGMPGDEMLPDDPSTVEPQDPPDHPGRGPMMRHHGAGRRQGGQGAIVRRLKLTDDQHQQFDKMTSTLAKKQIALRSKLMTMRVDMRDLFREGTPDRLKVRTLQDEMAKVQSDIRSNRTDYWFDVNKILTPDQQKIWKRGLMMQMGRAALRGHAGGAAFRRHG